MNAIKTLIVDDGFDSVTIKYRKDILNDWKIEQVINNNDHYTQQNTIDDCFDYVQSRLDIYAQLILTTKFHRYNHSRW